MIAPDIVDARGRLLRWIAMDESQNCFLSLTGFALAGLLSGLLDQVYDKLPFPKEWGSFLFLGAMFGLAIALCFWIFFRLRSIWKTLTFIAASAAACLLSFLAAGFIYENTLGVSWLQDQTGRMVMGHVFFTGGFTGAFIILAAALFLLPPKMNVGGVFIKAACWSVLGGLLGIIGQTVGDLWLALVWQTGMALVLALMLWFEKRRLALAGLSTSLLFL
jgi:hypothetical protein